ncbi:MAG: guanylate kinase [Chloroflexi bacterium]|nr:MAG: guanylate kinase [Chloroflexota bacterium]
MAESDSSSSSSVEKARAQINAFSSGPLLIVLSGPSGAGKDAILRSLKDSIPSLFHVATLTTRPRRPGEVEGEDYHFVSPEKFQELRERGELLEWAEVYGRLYGVPREPVRKALAEGKDVILRVDAQGAATLKRIAPEGVFIFVVPASLEEVRHRLERRGTESAEEFKLRMEKAEREMESWPLFDYIVVNREGMMESAVAQVRAIIMAEKCRTKPRRLDLTKLSHD